MKKIFVCAFGAFLMVGSAAGFVGFSGCGVKKLHRTHYTIDGEFFPQENKLVASMSVTVPNEGEDALESLSFELWPNAYREGAKYSPVSELYSGFAYYQGINYGGIEVTSVGGADSYEVGGEDENILSVALSKPLFPDEETTVSFEFEVTLANINHRLGVGVRNVTLANFYPVLCARGEQGFLEYVYANCGDPFVSECADYELNLTFPSEYEIAYSGVGQVTSAQGKKTLAMTADEVRDIACVLGKDLSCVTQDVAGVCVEYWYLVDEAPEETLKTATESLAYFSDTFGDYAYPRYTVVQTDFPYGGMEYSGLAMIATNLMREDIPAVVAHETAHQWWYSMVGSNQFETPWLDEGLAEYSAAMFLGDHPEYEISYSDFVKQSENGYRAYFSVKSQLSGEADTGMNRALTSYSGEYEYRNLAYDKGVIMLDRVRSVTGDRAFRSAMRRYFEKYNGRIASPEEFISCFHGSNVEELFRSFVDGKCVI